MRFLIHDRDTKFPAAFDTVFTTADVTIIRTPGYPMAKAPNANAVAERWIRSVRQECLDKILILNERHLHRVLIAYVDYYNPARPHQGIDQRRAVPLGNVARDGPVERRDILGDSSTMITAALHSAHMPWMAFLHPSGCVSGLPVDARTPPT